MTRSCALLLFCLLLPLPLQAQSTRAQADSATALAASRAFLTAFDSLRWEPFAAVWASEATVFLPDPDTPHLLVGRDTILGYFRGLFAEVEADHRSSLGILPRVHGLQAQTLNPGVVLVTLELGTGASPARRSLVWGWDEKAAKWTLRHLHASQLSPH